VEEFETVLCLKIADLSRLISYSKVLGVRILVYCIRLKLKRELK